MPYHQGHPGGEQHYEAHPEAGQERQHGLEVRPQPEGAVPNDSARRGVRQLAAAQVATGPFHARCGQEDCSRSRQPLPGALPWLAFEQDSASCSLYPRCGS
eukprot:8943841-Heterocapsa_arctica.AAC.1